MHLEVVGDFPCSSFRLSTGIFKYLVGRLKKTALNWAFAWATSILLLEAPIHALKWNKIFLHHREVTMTTFQFFCNCFFSGCCKWFAGHQPGWGRVRLRHMQNLKLRNKKETGTSVIFFNTWYEGSLIDSKLEFFWWKLMREQWFDLGFKGSVFDG